MKKINTKVLVVLVALVGGGGLAGVTRAQEGMAPEAGSSTPAVELATVEAALAAMEADAGLEPAVKDLLRPTYHEAVGAIKAAAENARKTAEFREAIQSAPGEVTILQTERAGMPPVEELVRNVADGDAEDLQKNLDARRVVLAELEEDLARVDNELVRIKGRPVEVSTRTPEAQQELDAVREHLASENLREDSISPGRTAERMLLEAKAAALISELKMLKQEQLSQSVREGLSLARRDLLIRQVENAKAVLESLSTLANERLASEAEEMTLTAGQTPQDAFYNDKAGQALVVEVQSLARDFESVVKDLKRTSEEHKVTRAELDRLTQKHEFIREQLKLGGTGQAMARSLFNMHTQLPSLRSLDQGEKRLKDQLDEVRLEVLKVDEKIRTHADDVEPFEAHPSEELSALVNTRRDVLEKLASQYGTLIRSKAELHGSNLTYRQKVEEVRNFLFHELFWVRSSPGVTTATFKQLPADVKWLASRENWAELGRTLLQSIKNTRVRTLGVFVLVAGLLLLRRRLGLRITQAGTAVRRISTDSYSYTTKALLSSILLALPLPLLLGYTCWLVGQAPPDASGWLQGLGHGLGGVASLLLGLSFLAVVCRDGGLGLAHFGWQEKSVRRFRSSLIGFGAVVLPTILIMACTLYGDGARHFDSLTRVVFVGACLGTTFLLWRMLRPSDGMLSATTRRDQSTPVFMRFRILWVPLSVGCPLALVVLAVSGFLVTACHLGLELIITMGLIASGVMLYWLTFRWFMIRERKLALAEALEERRARSEAATSDHAEEGVGEVIAADDAEEKLDLGLIGGQTQHLLRSCFVVLVLLATMVLWSRTIPIYEVLGALRVVGNLNLLQLGQMGLIIFVTSVVLRDIPGLLELAALRNTNLQIGTRAAISTLAQYTVVAVALISLFHILKVDGSKLGWIAAALSVGVGFGLQEVVANFVSGLILLFECPVRVGDIVTVDGTTGTVMRIRLRATTIMNWDRQELVVPNKALVTGTILNWTLTEPLNRVLLSVGVAYGSDTERARQILLNVADDHPLILDDPSPMATFEQFADSSLTLRLRAYLPTMEGRLATITELHADIDSRFAAAGIEIAMPQRDLHLRSGWEPSGQESTATPNSPVSGASGK